MSTALPDEVRAALAAGHKIEAIRLLRQHTGLGLAEAKAAVESGVLRSTSPSADQGRQLKQEAQSALDQGNLLQAIKLLRASKGKGLKNAKAIFDAARHTPNQPSLRDPSGLAPGEVPRSPLGARSIVIGAIILAVLIWQLLKTD